MRASPSSVRPNYDLVLSAGKWAKRWDNIELAFADIEEFRAKLYERCKRTTAK